MRNEAEVRARLETLKADHIYAVHNKLIWSQEDRSKEIRALEWILGERGEL